MNEIELLKKKINRLEILLTAVFFLLFILQLVGFTSTEKIEKQYRIELSVRDSIIENYSYRDSLIIDHLSKCSYIHKDSVGVGYQGYLYSKYHRKYKIEE